LLLSEYKEKLQIATQNMKEGKHFAEIKLAEQEKLVLEYVKKEKDALFAAEEERKAKEAL
jgi:hypothetical protein